MDSVRIVTDRFGCAGGCQPAVLKHLNHVAHQQGQAHVVVDQQHGYTFISQGAELIAKPDGLLLVARIIYNPIIEKA